MATHGYITQPPKTRANVDISLSYASNDITTLVRIAAAFGAAPFVNLL